MSVSKCRTCHALIVPARNRTHHMSCPDYKGPVTHTQVTSFWASWRYLSYCTCGQSYDTYSERGLAGQCPDRDVIER